MLNLCFFQPSTMSEEYTTEYNEDDAIAYMQKFMPSDSKHTYGEDDLLLVIDTIFEYYEKKGLFDVSLGNDDDVEEIDVEDLIKYVKKQLKKDKDNVIDLGDVEYLVRGELEYEDSLNEE